MDLLSKSLGMWYTEPNENELSFTAGPRSTDYKVKTKTTDKTTETVYNNWYKKVYEKTPA